MAAALEYVAVSIAGYQGEPWTEFRIGVGGVTRVGSGPGMPGFMYVEVAYTPVSAVADGEPVEEVILRFMVCPATVVFECGPPIAAPETPAAPTIYVPGNDPRVPTV